MTSWDATGEVGGGSSSDSAFARASNISLGGSLLALDSLELPLRFEGVARSRCSFGCARPLWRVAPELVGLEVPFEVELSPERRRALERLDPSLMVQSCRLRRFSEAGATVSGPVEVAESESGLPFSRRLRGEAVSSPMWGKPR